MSLRNAAVKTAVAVKSSSCESSRWEVPGADCCMVNSGTVRRRTSYIDDALDHFVLFMYVGGWGTPSHWFTYGPESAKTHVRCKKK